jgi:MFS family permease
VGVGASVAGGVRRLRAAGRRGGAAESGLSSLVELVFVNATADALVAVTLASSLFFSVPVGEARDKVALYLLTTMAPFALLAPVVGPLLDRFSHGRRVAIAATMLARAFLVYSLAGNLDNTLAVYPLALGVLVMSRGFGVARSAVVPRVLPESMTLVGVNSRLSLVSVLGGAISAPIGLGLGTVIGYAWVLRVCAVVFLLGVLLAFALPHHVDSAAGEKPVGVRHAVVGGSRVRRVLGELPAALRSAAALRALVGFLTLFLAFLLRTSGGGGVALAGLAVSAGLGSGLGVFLGGRFSRKRPELLLLVSLTLGTSACVVTATGYTTVTGLITALLATVAASMGKLSLDAVIQRDVSEYIRNSAFARSETVLQLAWVIGGAVGLIPFSGAWGFAIAGAVMVVALLAEVVSLIRVRRRRRRFRGSAEGRRRRGGANRLAVLDDATSDVGGDPAGVTQPDGGRPDRGAG